MFTFGPPLMHTATDETFQRQVASFCNDFLFSCTTLSTYTQLIGWYHEKVRVIGVFHSRTKTLATLLKEFHKTFALFWFNYTVKLAFPHYVHACNKAPFFRFSAWSVAKQHKSLGHLALSLSLQNATLHACRVAKLLETIHRAFCNVWHHPCSVLSNNSVLCCFRKPLPPKNIGSQSSILVQSSLKCTLAKAR